MNLRPVGSQRATGAPVGSAQERSIGMMLEVKDLKMYFPVKRGLLRRTTGYVKAIDGVTFSIDKGETLGLVGESGCGQTTVGKAGVRLLRPTVGSITFESNDISGLRQMELREYRKQ